MRSFRHLYDVTAAGHKDKQSVQKSCEDAGPGLDPVVVVNLQEDVMDS